MTAWVPLNVHSQYSILEATTPIKAIAKRAAEMSLKAVALTDSGNLFGAVDFFKACSAEEIKPIIGCQFYLAPVGRKEKIRGLGGRNSYNLVLLAKNMQGYRNLCELSSIGYLEGFYYHPRIDKEVLEQYKDGLICLTGALGSGLAMEILEGEEGGLEKEIEWYKNLFGEDLYFELQRHEMKEEELEDEGIMTESWLFRNYQDNCEKQKKIERALLEASEREGIKCVATNATRYIERSDWEAHEIQLNIQSGEPCEVWEKDSLGNNKTKIPNPKRRTFYSHAFHFKSPEEMQNLFKDIPEALANTVEVAEKCNVTIDFDTKHYPVFVPPELEGKEFTKEEQVKAAAQYLKQICEDNIKKRYTEERLNKVKEVYPKKDPSSVVKERLEYELNIITMKELCDYLLIVWDFIHWAKGKGIPVGPGRGSGAGSIILYLMGITDIEPLRFHLFFERFINPERMSYPDIDVDICMERRGEVIEYTVQKYGVENVAQIITFGSIKAKLAIKDVGRVLSIPLTKVNHIAKLIPEDPNMTLNKALEIDPELQNLYANDEETKRIIDLGRKLEGSIRNTGIHAAGIIVSSQPLTHNIPVCKSKDAQMAVTQFSMKPVEAVGMLKIDFLGLKTLTSIQIAAQSVKENTGKEIDYIDLPLDDEPTFNLLNQGKTLGVFQLESSGMQELARQLHLDKFEEIIAVVSLYRPGPMDMIPSFIARKHGKEPIEYDHPAVKEILDETYGIMVYQEQVMQIAQTLANYSLGEGDVLRRAMGKKDMGEMAKQREKFIQGAEANAISSEVAEMIFDKMEKFAAYGFNKSHAAAYGFLSYVTAYFKANYPKEWMAALMTCDRDDLTKVAKFIRECQDMEIDILPPDVNEAGAAFVATKKGIRFAMSGIKGIGEGVVEAIVNERENGPYKSIYDFIKRVDTKKVGKKAIENLVDAGSFDFTNWSRDALRENIELMVDTAAREKKENAAGVMTLFSLMGEDSEKQFEKPPEVKNKTSQHDIFMKEKILLGFFLTGHPMKFFKNRLQKLSCIPLAEVKALDHDTVIRTAFIVETAGTRIATKSQRKFAILEISDGIERFELPIWPDLYEEKPHILQENQLLYAIIQVDKQEGITKLSCRWFDDLTKADDSMIEACDRAYDKAKMKVERFKFRAKERKNDKEKNKEKENEKKMSDEKLKKLSLSLDADTMHLSSILELKGILSEHSGNNPFSIDFMAGEGALATLEVDAKWGVTPSADLEKALKKLAVVKDTKTG